MISIKSLDPRGDETERNLKPSEEIEIEEVKLFGEGDDRSVRIGKTLLKKYYKCFVWSTVNMLKIDHKIACHKLAINLNFKPIQ